MPRAAVMQVRPGRRTGRSITLQHRCSSLLIGVHRRCLLLAVAKPGTDAAFAPRTRSVWQRIGRAPTRTGSVLTMACAARGGLKSQFSGTPRARRITCARRGCAIAWRSTSACNCASRPMLAACAHSFRAIAGSAACRTAWRRQSEACAPAAAAWRAARERAGGRSCDGVGGRGRVALGWGCVQGGEAVSVSITAKGGLVGVAVGQSHLDFRPRTTAF